MSTKPIGQFGYDYNATVAQWTDGDTLVLDIDLGFYLVYREKVRLYGVNCPEISTAAGKAARDFMNARYPQGTRVKAYTAKASKPTEKYGRWLASVEADRDFAMLLIEHGHGVAYYGQLQDAAPQG